jgi:hypothetical protein
VRKLEKAVVKPVDKWAKEHKVISLIIDYAGWPDRAYLFPSGVHIYIEFKRPGKKPRELQKVRLRTLVEYKQLAYSFDSAAEAIAELEQHL